MQQWGSPASNTRTHPHQPKTSPRPTHPRLPRPNQPLPLAPIHRKIDRLRALARFRPNTSRTRCTHRISPARRVRLNDEADRATASCSQYARHPMWGATPDVGRYTRYGALHPIRRGAMPTDRVQCHFQQAFSRTRNHTNHQPTSTPPLPTSATPVTSRYTRCGALHPMWGATPDVGRYTRCGALHPIRRGAMPTDRVQRPTQQALSRRRTIHLIPHRHTCRPHLEHLPLWV